MEPLSITGTSSTPEVDFSPDGRLLIEGRSLPENAEDFYNSLIEWILELQSDTVILDMKFEYFNSASSKKIYELLMALDLNRSAKNILINWYYEVGDEDCKESGELFETILTRSVFNYHEYAEVY